MLFTTVSFQGTCFPLRMARLDLESKRTIRLTIVAQLHSTKQLLKEHRPFACKPRMLSRLSQPHKPVAAFPAHCGSNKPHLVLE